MSDTTKITKARVNGVLYDLGGSGSGGISGAYLAPKTLISPEYTRFEQAAINPIALVEQLEKAEVSVDESVLDPSENAVTLDIGYVHPDNGGKDPIILLRIVRDVFGFTAIVSAMGAYVEGKVPEDKTTLRAIINYIFTEMFPELHFTLDNNGGYLENFINIYYQDANEILHYYISNMTEFCEEVIIEYNSSSGSDSGSGN